MRLQGSVVMKNAYNTKIFACKICPSLEPTESLEELTEHVATSVHAAAVAAAAAGQGEGGSSGSLQCCECKDRRVFETLPDIVKHVERYHGAVWQPCRCDHCPLGFQSNDLLQAHLEGQHSDKKAARFFNDGPGKAKAGLCPDCGLTFETEKTLKTHILMVHSVRREVSCIEPDCNQVFQSLGELASHVSSAHDKVLNLKVSNSKKSFFITSVIFQLPTCF